MLNKRIKKPTPDNIHFVTPLFSLKADTIEKMKAKPAKIIFIFNI